MSFKVNKQSKILGKYQVIRTLGTGLFKVKLVQDPVSGIQYAVKVSKFSLRKPALEKEANVLREISKLDIPNVIKYVEFIDNTEKPVKNSYQLDYASLQAAPEYSFKAALVLELAANETIFDIIFHNKQLEERLARTYFIKLVETIVALHAKGYVHRDLKPENILLDDKFQLKLADFGFARDFNEFNQDKMSTKVGTETYVAPEIYTSKAYSGAKADAFSCGVILFLFIFGRPPFFKACSNDPFYKNFMQGKPEKFWSIYEEKMNESKEFDAGLKALISDLLKSNPEERISVDKICEYEWMKGETYNDEELIEVMKPLKLVVDQERKNSKK